MVLVSNVADQTMEYLQNSLLWLFRINHIYQEFPYSYHLARMSSVLCCVVPSLLLMHLFSGWKHCWNISWDFLPSLYSVTFEHSCSAQVLHLYWILVYLSFFCLTFRKQLLYIIVSYLLRVHLGIFHLLTIILVKLKTIICLNFESIDDNWYFEFARINLFFGFYFDLLVTFQL